MDERLTFSVVKEPDHADPDAICVTLFEEDGRAMAWFVGPVVPSPRRGPSVPYLPRSARRRVATALVTAMVEHLNICVIDPLDLLATV